jgi:hypothetical protein
VQSHGREKQNLEENPKYNRNALNKVYVKLHPPAKLFQMKEWVKQYLLLAEKKSL